MLIKRVTCTRSAREAAAGSTGETAAWDARIAGIPLASLILGLSRFLLLAGLTVTAAPSQANITKHKYKEIFKCKIVYL